MRKRILSMTAMTAGTAIWAVACLSTVTATTYHGTITEIVTDTSDPLNYVGETFIGSYLYESPTIDGNFFTLYGIPGLQGSLYCYDRYLTFNYPNSGVYMGVSGGQVSSFYASDESADTGMGFSLSTFNFSVHPGGPGNFWEPKYRTWGTLSFSPPEVPDAIRTLSLLMESLVGLFAFAAVVLSRERLKSAAPWVWRAARPHR